MGRDHSENNSAILESLRHDRNIRVECPSCAEEFPLAKAELFHDENLTPAAVEYLNKRKDGLADRREELRDMKRKATVVAGRIAVDAGFGKIVEKVAPMLPGFPFAPGDCRAIFEPIDYVVFEGLSAHGLVDALRFSDVKSGRARLKHSQAQIRDVVGRGRVEFKKLEG